MLSRILKILGFLTPLLLWSSSSSASSYTASFPSKYDDQIKSAVTLYWPTYPNWTAWKSQLWQESHLDPFARSGVGAEGLAQFMPGTWLDTLKRMKYDVTVSRTEGSVAILAGAMYMAQLAMQWSSPRPMEDRWKLARASYNAGTGNLLKAQRACDGKPGYNDIVGCLPGVTGAQFSKETIGYVCSIDKWREQMDAALAGRAVALWAYSSKPSSGSWAATGCLW